MTDPANKNRRRNLVINKPVQRRIILSISVVPLLTLVGATLAVAILTGRVLDEARSAEEMLPTLGPLFISLFLFILAAGGVVVIQALKHSHKIAGPMYRLVKSMERMRGGDLSFRVTLRDGDELTELAEELNRVMEWLREHPPQGVSMQLVADAASRPDKQEESAAVEEPVGAGVGE